MENTQMPHSLNIHATGLYLREQYGSVFWIEDGALHHAAITSNGLIDFYGMAGEVEFWCIDNDQAREMRILEAELIKLEETRKKG